MSTTDAALGINGRNKMALVAFICYHLDGISRAMTLTIAAADIIAQNNAVVSNPYGMSNLNRCFFFGRGELDGSCGADVRAGMASYRAIASLKGHLGLHEMLRIHGRPKDTMWAGRDAELTSRACLREATVAM